MKDEQFKEIDDRITYQNILLYLILIMLLLNLCSCEQPTIYTNQLPEQHAELKYQFNIRGIELIDFHLHSVPLDKEGTSKANQIWINENLTELEKEFILFHEYGHLLGMKHGENQIMTVSKINLAVYKWQKESMLKEYFVNL